METISNILFFISNGLLVPVVILLLAFFVIALLTAVNFFGDYQQRKNILKDTSSPEDREAVYEMVEDEEILSALQKVFRELLDDTDIEL